MNSQRCGGWVRASAWWVGVWLAAIGMASCQGVDARNDQVAGQATEQPVPLFHTAVGCDFVLISGVTVDLAIQWQGPRHKVTLSPFYCARFPVTKRMYAQFLRDTKYPYVRDRFDSEFADLSGTFDVPYQSPEQWRALPVNFAAKPTGDHTMEDLSWIEGEAYARWLSKREGRQFLFPSEAQARWLVSGGVALGDESFWWMATEPSSPDCWMPNPFQNYTSPTGQGFIAGTYPMNPLGIFLGIRDVWTGSWYRNPYLPERIVDPLGPARNSDSRRATQSVMREAHSAAIPERPSSTVLLISPVLPQDHHVWHPVPEPDATPIAVHPLPRMEIPLGANVVLPMRQIPAGAMVMGRPFAERPWAYESPPTTLHMQTYWLGETEVTQVQFQAVTGINPSRVHGDDLPVHSLTMAETMAFTDLLTHQERAAGRLGMDEEYRLPTEAEWERAARAGATTRWSCGEDPELLRRYAWFEQMGQNGPKPVATRWPNAWGFYDMEGNVLERCCHGVSEFPGGELQTHWIPQSPGHADYRETYAARGGAFNMGAIACESTLRRGVNGGARVSHLGFRLARGPVLPYFPRDAKGFFLRLFDHDFYRADPDYLAIMKSKGIRWSPASGNP